MKARYLLTTILVLGILFISCDKDDGISPREQDFTNLQEIYDISMQALTEGDTDTIVNTMSTDWCMCGPGGYMTRKAYEENVFPMIANGLIQTIDTQSISWEIDSDLAVSIAHETYTLNVGELVTDDYMTTMVYKKSGSDWQVIFVHQSVY